MIDREKVIKGLEYHLKELSVGKTCYECPYFGDNPCEIQLIANTLELLKWQEPVEPIPPTDESDLWRCGNCNHQLFKCTHQRYCEMCGREVKWDA